MPRLPCRPFPLRAWVLGLACLVAPLQIAAAGELGTYRYPLTDEVQAVLRADVDGDGRDDLVVVTAPKPGETGPERLVFLRTPDTPVARSFFAAKPTAVVDLEGDLADAGALVVGRFRHAKRDAIRLLGPRGFVDVGWDGTRITRVGTSARGSLFRRSAGHRIAVWDGAADLDGDRLDEVWYPEATGDGKMRVVFGGGDRSLRLSLGARNRGSTSNAELLVRNAYVPRLEAVDLTGQGHRSLVALEGTALRRYDVARISAQTDAPIPATQTIPLPFLAAKVKTGPTGIHAPRVQLADVDRDGITDLLVTLITGRSDKLGSLRTTLFHYAGPILDPKTGALGKPRARLDTESVALHPSFLDIDGDGDLDYVGDSIRAEMKDLYAQFMGKDPKITYVGFRFDKQTGTYESTPCFTTERTYPHAEAAGNAFGRTAWLGGDFDGDRLCDLLDIGDLGGVEILRTTRKAKGRFAHDAHILPRIPVRGGLVADGLLLDVDGNALQDAVLWSGEALYLIVPKEPK